MNIIVKCAQSALGLLQAAEKAEERGEKGILINKVVEEYAYYFTYPTRSPLHADGLSSIHHLLTVDRRCTILR